MESSQNDYDNSSSNSNSYGSINNNDSNQSSLFNSTNNNNNSINNNNNGNNGSNNNGNNNDDNGGIKEHNNTNRRSISSSSNHNNGGNNDYNNNNGGSSNSNKKNKNGGGGSSNTNSNNNNNNSHSKNKSNSPSSHSSKGSHSKSQKSLGDGSQDKIFSLIAGPVVGVGIFLLFFILCYVVCCKKKKKRDTMQYYGNHSRKGRHQQNGSKNYKGASGMPPPQWGQSIPAPPLMMGTNMSSENYSSGPIGPVLPPPHPLVALGFTKNTFTYDELAAATNGFSQDRLLGQGGFGYVHKGVLPNGKEVAVKSLKSGSGQGEREFQAEVEIISRVHHRHLVSLVGYCSAGGQRMLVYEFIPNNTLEFHLHGKGQPVMDFPMRMKVALGSAKGLAYLHEDCHPKIIHRDIKTANILIDNAFEGKVADFGLAKLSSDTNTHVSTRVMGTFGYLAPEYAASGKLTEKSDVFSFGVMLLELVTGRRPIDPYADEDDTLVDWSRPYIGRALDERIFDGFVDPRLKGEFDPQEMMRLIASAGASVRHSAKRRPKMSQIVRALEGDVSLEDLKEGPQPRSESTVSNSGGSSEYENSSYDSDMKRFRRTELSNEYPSNDYGHTSSSSGEFSSKFSSPGPARKFL